MSLPEKIDLGAAFAALEPRPGLSPLAAVGDMRLRIGRFAWHSHAAEDELFWVVSGHLAVKFRAGRVELCPGQMLVVPRGVEHRTSSEVGAEVVVIHPASTQLPPAAE
jgi:mannose-6-phosphate isomerase-like protein (cupin superfamily)